MSYQRFNEDKLRPWPSGGSQMLQNFGAVFVRPVVENLANKEDTDVFLPRWLRLEEIVDLRSPTISARLL